MTLASPTSRVDYIGNGSTDTYPYTFKILAATDLLVTVRDTADVETTLAYLTDYTVTGAGSGGGGDVVLTAGNLASGYSLTIRRVRPLTQGTDIRNQGAFYPEAHEDAFDHQVMIAQQHADELARTIKLPETEVGTSVGTTIPSAAARAGKLLGFDGSGNPTALTTIPTSSVAISAFGESLIDDADAETARATLGIDGAGGVIETGDIADDAVTQDKISNDAVGADQLRDDPSVDANRAVTTNHIRDGAVTSSKLAAGAITHSNLDTDLQGGWISVSDTLTYASASSFTVPGDKTATFRFGARIKLTQTTAKYFVVKNVSFSSSTTVTVTGGDDYSLANAAITGPFVSYMDSPVGFPVFFNYTPTYSGWSSTTALVCKFSMSVGGLVFYSFHIIGTSNDTKSRLGYPIIESAGTLIPVAVKVEDNSVDQSSPGYGYLNYLESSFRFGLNYASSLPSVGTGSWTASGSKRVTGSIIYHGSPG